jgi:shikimate kinase
MDMKIRAPYIQKILDLEAENKALREKLAEAKQPPFAYAGEYNVNNIRDMRTVVYRNLSDFDIEQKQPDVIYPLYR